MVKTRRSADEGPISLLTVQIGQEVRGKLQESAEADHWSIAPLVVDDYFNCDNRPFLVQRAIDAPSCIGLIDFDVDPELALATAECLSRSFCRKNAIVALSSSTNPDLLVRAMRAGCTEFLGRPFDPHQFTEMLGRLERRWSVAPSVAPQSVGKVISFFGAKGGVGTTTLAIHLAVFLIHVSKKKVLLIDNHVQLGHVALYLGMDGEMHHFQELVRNVSRLDQDLLRGFVATHSSGLDVLSSPDLHGDEPYRDAEAVKQTLDFLKTQYDFIILDCEASYADANLAIIDLCDSVYLVATPEVGAIRDLSRYADGLTHNEQAIDKLEVVINRYSSNEAVAIEQIEKAVRLPIAIRISNQYTDLVRAINVGQPVLPERKSEFTLQLLKWASVTAGVKELVSQAPQKKRLGLWK